MPQAPALWILRSLAVLSLSVPAAGQRGPGYPFPPSGRGRCFHLKRWGWFGGRKWNAPLLWSRQGLTASGPHVPRPFPYSAKLAGTSCTAGSGLCSHLVERHDRTVRSLDMVTCNRLKVLPDDRTVRSIFFRRQTVFGCRELSEPARPGESQGDWVDFPASPVPDPWAALLREASRFAHGVFMPQREATHQIALFARGCAHRPADADAVAAKNG
jgi:hypothetical protein